MSDRPSSQTLSQVRTGLLIREARGTADLSQIELAERVGTKQSVISRWERGLDTPRIDTLARILHACGLEADLTFRRHDDEDRSQIRMHLDMTPDQRLTYLEDMLEFEELAASARPVEQRA